MIFLISILYNINFKKNKKEEEKSLIIEKENLVIDIKYQLNTLYKYENINLTKMEGGGGGGTQNYNKEIIQLADIFLIIKKKI